MSEKTPVSPSPTALLRNLHVAAPCSESWDAMPGSDRVRSCERCQHRVYNLSEMTSAEAAELLRKSEGRLCVRFYRRADGTIMTKDCPVGVQAVRRRVARAASVAFASVAVACGASYMGKPRAEQPRWVQWVLNTLSPEEEAAMPSPRPSIELPMVRPDVPTMGAVAPPPPAVASITVMGTPAPHLPTSFDRPTMGEVAVEAPESGKPFLKGLDTEMGPDSRPDPFVKHPRTAKDKRSQ